MTCSLRTCIVCLLLILAAAAPSARAQQAFTSGTLTLTESFSGFDGSGFSPSPAAGQLDSDAFAVTGFSDGDLGFGGTRTSGDFAGGASPGGETDGAIYAAEASLPDGPWLFVQPIGDDFTPGTLTVRYQNSTGATITDVDVAYEVMTYNDQGRANSFDFSYSTDNATYTDVSALDYTSPEAADASPAWTSAPRSTTVSGLSIADGDYFYIRFTSDDVSGSDSRDEIGVDDIVLTATTATTTSTTPEDDFADGDFTSDPAWSGDTGSFSVLTDAALPSGTASTDGHFLASNTSVGDAVLVTASTETDEWRFSLGTPSFSPSGSNYLGVVLMADAALSGDVPSATWQGYYLRIGENGDGDAITLYRQDGASGSTEVGTFPNSPVLADGLPDGLNVRVMRSDAGAWELFYDTGFQYGSVPATSAGTLTDATYGTSSYFGVFTHFGSPDASRRVYFDHLDAGLSQESDVAAPSSQISGGTFSSLIDTEAEAVDVFRFRLRDGGASGDADGAPTEVTGLQVRAGGSATADFDAALAGLTVDVDGSPVMPSSVTIAADQIDLAFAPGDLTVPDDGSVTVTLGVYLQHSIADGGVLSFFVDQTAGGFTTDDGSSGFAATFPSAVTSNDFTLDVAATELAFTEVPTQSVAVNEPFSVTVQAQDANGNLDADATHSVTLGKDSGPGTLSGTLAQSLAGGEASFEGLQVDDDGDYVLSASASGLTDATSGTVTAVGTIVFQGFENGGADGSWSIESGAGSISADAGSSSQRIRTGSASWQATGGTRTLDLQQQNVSGYEDVRLVLHLSATGGLDGGDVVEVLTSLDGAAFGAADLTLTGNNNATWSYSSIAASTTAGTPATFSPAGGGDRDDDGDGYSTLIVHVPDGAGTVDVRVVATNGSSEYWNLDDMELQGHDVGGGVNTQTVAVAPASQIGPATIASTADTEGEALHILAFDLQDGGVDGDGDALPTEVTAIRLLAEPGSAALDEVLAGLTVEAGGSAVAPSSVTIASGQIDLAFASGDLTVPDDASLTVTLGTYLQRRVADGAQFAFRIDAAADGFTADLSAGSGFASIFPADVASSTFTIAVTASELAFVAPPSSVGVGSDFNLMVRAQDANGNLDAGAAQSVTLERISGPGTLSSTAGLTQPLSGGTVTFSAVQVDEVGTYTLTASASGLTNATSGPITAGGAPALLISEVTDPSDTAAAKFVELYNASGAAIDFGNTDPSWYLALAPNGNAFGSVNSASYEITRGVVEAGDVFLLANDASAFNTAYGFDPDAVASVTVNANGNDVYGLYLGDPEGSGTPVDVYGQEGTDGTGQPWEFTDARVVRSSNVAAPSTTFDLGQWTLTDPAATVDMKPGFHSRSGVVVGGDDGNQSDPASTDDGWRLLSVPMAGVTVGDLAAQNLIQGVPGSFPDAQPNFYTTYAGAGNGTCGGNAHADDAYNCPPGLSDTLVPGSGFLWFFFSDETAATGASAFRSLPFFLEAVGTPNESDVTVTFADLLPSGQDGTDLAFFLLGNPFPTAFDLDGLDLTAQGFQAAVSLYDTGTDGYVTLTQGTADDVISRFEGFWIEDNAASGIQHAASVTFDAASRVFGAEGVDFRGGSSRVAEPAGPLLYRTLPLHLEARNGAGEVVKRDVGTQLFFSDRSAIGPDAYDATKRYPLAPPVAITALHGAYADGSTWLQSQHALPYYLSEDVTVDLEVQTYFFEPGALTLSWPDSAWTNMPEGWTITLTDRAEDATVDLREESTYTFILPDAARAGQAEPPSQAVVRTVADKADAARFAVTITPAALPVELARFVAAGDGPDVLLDWQTLSEDGNAGFHVEARPADGVAWRTLGFVEGAGTTSEAQAYRFRATGLDAGTYTFRLRQQDLDGTEHVSPEVEAAVGIAGTHALAGPMPNPASARATLSLGVGRAQEVRVAVYDALGRRVAVAFDGPLEAGASQAIALPTGTLPSGVYFVRVEGEAFSETARLVVAR